MTTIEFPLTGERVLELDLSDRVVYLHNGITAIGAIPLGPNVIMPFIDFVRATNYSDTIDKVHDIPLKDLAGRHGCDRLKVNFSKKRLLIMFQYRDVITGAYHVMSVKYNRPNTWFLPAKIKLFQEETPVLRRLVDRLEKLLLL